ncbi:MULTISPECIES: hypothetical protein [Sinorhizobium]|uniref:Uncharacterized protein n=1 Tax=Sinorhizobium americanum TaxID=194963 RepID=A0A2S3YNE7_9HYPH|nr:MULTISPECIES: hypothetical protein [Sinorhizobium]PDT33062.1 hypothetical protein CO656_28835 [Sinorhizobium sp. FG01]PDT49487.1 hypothetical protein CO664_27445 [Sinorhizobium sp. NG07B]POH30548.1 hypothetical protein ATY31_14750 [Sinorhizobium americanum]POH33320.1 hypothetical protein ATY30_02565 [Sinorhizobium americanum]
MQKTAQYRRAIWGADNRGVEHFLRQALGRAPEVADTKFSYRAGVDAQIVRRSTQGRGLGVVFAMFSEGSSASVVENGGPQITRTPAPRGREFLKTEVHLVIEGDHMAYLANGQTNDGQITNLVSKFLEEQGVNRANTQFAFMPRSNRREIERLLRVGVKSIDLGISSFLTTVEDVNNHQRAHAPPRGMDGIRQIGDGLSQVMRNAFGRHRTPEEIQAASEIQARIHLGYDGRGADAILPQLMTDVAERVANSGEEFSIVTKHDVVITREKLVVKQDVNIEGDDITLNADSTFATLRDCLRQWRNDGVLDE